MTTFEALRSELKPLIAPSSDEQPSGRDLEGSLALSALEAAAQEPEEPGIEGVASADERDWRAVQSQARKLLGESKDLRVAVLLTRSLLHVEGLAGFCAGVELVRDMVNDHWRGLYPSLDEDGDPMSRLNALHELVSAQVLTQLRRAPFLSSRELGTFSVNDVLVVSGSPLGRAAESQAAPQHVSVLLDRADEAELRDKQGFLQAAREAVHGLVSFVAEQTGCYLQCGALVAAKGERVGVLDSLLGTLEKQLAERAPRPDAGDRGESDPGAHRGREERGDQLSRREDVVRMLDQICEYYARHEPSSPVPLLLTRAKRLVSMDFMAIMRDLATQGLPQVSMVAGVLLPEEE